MQQPEDLTHFAHPDLAVIVYPAPYFEFQQFCYLADWKIHPAMKSHLLQLLGNPCLTLLKEKVYERIGRLKQKYPLIAWYYEISNTVETETVTNKRTKEKTKERKIKSMTWKIKQDIEPKGESGMYFLRTSLSISEKLILMTYNIIREIKYSFQTLKTDLDLRPIYHKKDNATMAHLNLGQLAYWVVNTIR